MLFNSAVFLFVFLPVMVAGYWLLARTGWGWARIWWLVAGSLVFYGWWELPYLALLLGSVAVNFGLGRAISAGRVRGRDAWVRTALWGGIAFNLGLLGYYKYSNFFIENVAIVLGRDVTLAPILLPLAISFFTFQQIAFLLDVARGEVSRAGAGNYAVFVLFFPQLIAGPIVHYREVVPQFADLPKRSAAAGHLAVGLTIFAIGLFKKTVIADTAALYSTPVYDAALAGTPIGLFDGWVAAFAYTMQIYFDFSGYSDMAIGLARMFGILLPLNFHSPLRAVNIIDFWRRWHMTLQRFIASYVYTPLATPFARLAIGLGRGRWTSFMISVGGPVMLAMLAIGFWHGAGWTFVLFGAMHGVFVVVNEAWREGRKKLRRQRRKAGLPEESQTSFVAAHVITVLCVVVSIVMFRAESVPAALAVYAGMAGLNGATPSILAVSAATPLAVLAAGWLVIYFAPNTQQILRDWRPALNADEWLHVSPPPLRARWAPNLGWAVPTAVTLFLAVAFVSRQQTEFIYFNF